MAGIPAVMRAMLGSLASKLTGGAIVQSRSVTAYVGESTIAEQLRNIQAIHPDVDIGSYPFTREGRYGTTLVARGTDAKAVSDVVEEIHAMIIAAGAMPSE